MTTVVTISASVGAGGSWVGPEVARQLDVQFVDRLIPVAVAESLAVPLDQALARDEKSAGLVSRLLNKLGAASLPYGASPVPGTEQVLDDEVFRTKTEQVIRDLAGRQGAVFLGRGAAIVLAGQRGALHVRLDGEREARIERMAERQSIPSSRAARLVDDGDRAREAYIRHFYRADLHDTRLYHLAIDSTVIPLEVCAEMIVTAARSAVPSQPPGGGPASSTGPG
jgi:cytidylate kinase